MTTPELLLWGAAREKAAFGRRNNNTVTYRFGLRVYYLILVEGGEGDRPQPSSDQI